MRKLLICFAIALAMGAGAVKAAMPEVRIAVLKFGTVNWVMATIKRQGYDTAAGYRWWCAATPARRRRPSLSKPARSTFWCPIGFGGCASAARAVTFAFSPIPTPLARSW